MATKKAAKKNGKGAQSIPLDNIPERTERKTYTDDFKLEVVKRVNAGESADSVARELGIPSSSVIHGWRTRVASGLPVTNRTPRSAAPKPGDNASEIAHALKTSLERAHRARDDRLEAAAMILAADIGGKQGEQLAKAVRSFKRQPHA